MKNLFAVMSMLLCLALSCSAGPGRPSFNSRPSYSGGFRSSGSSGYRSFSSSPSRSFSFRSGPSLSTASRPAAAPRSYTYSAPKATMAAPVSRSTTKRTVITNHYHGDDGHGSSGGGGLSLLDYAMLNSLTNHSNSPTYVTTQPVVVGGAYQPPAASAPMIATDSYQDGPAVIYQRDESHFWRNLFVFLFGMGCLYGVYRLVRYLAVEV